MPFISSITPPDVILRKPKFATELIDIEQGDDPVFVYRFTLEVDVQAASKRQATKISLEALPRIPNPPKTPDIARTAKDYLKVASQAQRIMAQFKRSVDATIFAREEKSILSLGLANFLKSNSHVTRDGNKALQKDVLTDVMSNATKFVTTKMPFENASLITATPDKVDIVQRVFESKVSNARNVPYNPNVSQLGGVGSGKSVTQENHRVLMEAARRGVDPAAIKAATDFIDTPLANPISSILYSPPSVAPPAISYMFTPKFTSTTVDLRIRKSDLGDNTLFYVRCALKDGKGTRRTEYEVINVPHSTYVNAYITPDLRPSLKAAIVAPGKISVDVKQLDKKAKRVKVFRRTFPASDGTSFQGSPWQIILDTQASLYESVTFTDDIMYSGLVMYRALTYGSNNKPSEDFASQIVMPTDLAPQKNALVASCRFQDQTPKSPVIIDVTDIPEGNEGITVVRLRRYDMTYNSSRNFDMKFGSGFEYIGGNQHVVARDKLTFVDDTAQAGRDYKYIPVGISATVGTVYGTPGVISIPLVRQSPTVTLKVTAPRMVQGRQGVLNEIEMDLDAEFTDFGFNKVKETLAAKGQAQLYNDQIDKNRSEFGKLISFIVDRENHRTGDIETFGMVDSGKFKDDASTRKVANVSEPDPGVNYTYTVTAVVNNPDSLFPQVTQKKVDKDTLNIVTSILSKLSSPITKNTGVIPSTARQFDPKAADDNFPQDPRESGITNIQDRFPFSFGLPTNAITDLVVREYRKFNRLSWSFDGDVRDVDHFRIELLSGGGSILIDTVHCDSSTNQFFYRHKDIGYAMNYSYRITPVNLEFKTFSSVATTVILASVAGIKQDIPFEESKRSTGLPDFKFPVDMGALKF